MTLLNFLHFALQGNKWKKLSLNLFTLAPLQSIFKAIARVIILLKHRSDHGSLLLNTLHGDFAHAVSFV